MDGAWTNQSFRHMDLAGPEPEWDPRALDCWTKYFAWDRRRNNTCCFTNRYESADGTIRYFSLLRSQRTRKEREGTPYAESRYYLPTGFGYRMKGARAPL